MTTRPGISGTDDTTFAVRSARRAFLPAAASLALLVLATAPTRAARAQSATRLTGSIAAGVLGSSESAARSGVAFGGSVGAYRPGTLGVLAFRVEASLARVLPFGEDCPASPGSGSCGSAGPTAIGGAMASLVTPVRGATRPFVTVGAGAFHRMHETGAGITSAALSAGIGVASLQPGRSGGLELRAIWLPGRESAVLIPLSLTAVF